MFLLSQINPVVGVPLAVAFILVTAIAMMRGSSTSRRSTGRDIFTISDVAKMCNVSDQEVRGWINSGLVVSRPSKKVVLILKKDLDQFFDHTRV